MFPTQLIVILTRLEITRGLAEIHTRSDRAKLCTRADVVGVSAAACSPSDIVCIEIL